MTAAKIQHYVPQFLLRKFGNGKKDQVWVYDKANGRSFATNAKNIASESRFYDFELDGQSISLEPMLSNLESKVKPIIEGILKTDSLEELSDEDKATLAVFLSIQFTRTKTFREQWCDFPRMLREHLEVHGETVAPGSQAADLICEITENDSKAETARFITQAPSIFAPLLIAKKWILAATTRKHPFVISDNPLTLQNMTDMSPYGNLGLAVPGIEIYFPLSPLRALAMWCPTIVDTVLRGAKKLRQLPSSASPRVNIGDPSGVFALEKSIQTGCPLSYVEQNVLNFNSLQIARSERYIFSCVNEFQLAKEMLETHPNLKRGPRAKIA